MEHNVIWCTYYAASIKNLTPIKYSTCHDGRIRLPTAILSSEDAAADSASFRLIADCSVLYTYTYKLHVPFTFNHFTGRSMGLAFIMPHPTVGGMHKAMLQSVRLSICLSHARGGCTICPNWTAIGRTYRFTTQHLVLLTLIMRDFWKIGGIKGWCIRGVSSTHVIKEYGGTL